MKKITAVLSMILLLATALVVTAGSDTHSTTVVVGNANPVITSVPAVANVDLVAGGTKAVTIVFDVTDSNGEADIVDAEGKVYLIKAGEPVRSNATGTCEVSPSGNVDTFTCTVPMEFYDIEGEWQINVTAKDVAGAVAFNDTTTLTVNALDDILFNDTAITCNGALSSPSTDNKCDILEITNRGNQDYTTFTETAYNLDDDTTGTFVIGTGNFTVNVTDAVEGTHMIDGSGVVLPDASMTRGASSTEVIYTYVDIPTGKPADTYTSTSDWSIATT